MELNEIARKTLAEIIARHAQPPELDVRRCEGLLRDLCGEHKQEINVLVTALREKVVADLLASGGSVPAAVLLSRCARKLHEQAGITEDLARWSVESWALALGVIAADTVIAVEKSTRAAPAAPQVPVRSIKGQLLITVFGVLLLIGVIARPFSCDPKPPPPQLPRPQEETKPRKSEERKPDALHCPDCGANLVLRHNRTTGEPFFGCSRYPLCKGTRQYDEKLAKKISLANPHGETKPPKSEERKLDALHCPDCGANLVLRHNRTTGEPFFGCSRYPLCKGTRRYDEKLAKKISLAKKRSLPRAGPRSTDEGPGRSTGEEFDPPEER